MSDDFTTAAVTLQYGTLKCGRPAALAYADVSLTLVRSYRSSPRYAHLIYTLLNLLNNETAGQTVEAIKNVEELLALQLNEVMRIERDKDKSRKAKWAPMAPRKNRIDEQSSEDDEEAEELTPEEIEAAAAAERERQEQEIQRNNERLEALQRQKEENEARLRERARQVDTRAIEEKLRKEGAVLLNSGSSGNGNNSRMPSNKKGGGFGGGKGQQQQQPSLSAEDIAQMLRDVAQTVKQKERFKTALQLSGEAELEEATAGAREEAAHLAEEVQKLSSTGPSLPNVASYNKGKIAQLQQKLSKQSIERDRFALQLKTLEPSAARDEYLAAAQQRDELAVAIELMGQS